MSDVKNFLDQSSGSRYPAYKWGVSGAVLTGKIIDPPSVVNRPNLNTGEPEDNLVIAIETAEGHQFSLWVRRGFLAQAISDAVRESPAQGLEPGGTLHVKHTENRDTGRPKPARVFKARYEPPQKSVNPSDIFGDDTPF